MDKNFTKYNLNELKAINDTLKEVITNSDYCNNCMYHKSDNTCFFGYVCITNNFSNYRNTNAVWIKNFKEAFETLKKHNIEIFWDDMLIDNFDDFDFV